MKNLLVSLIALLSLNVQAATSPEVAYKLSQESKAVLVDVREASEIKEGMVKTAKWFPMSRIESDKNWKKDFVAMTEGKKIFLYCRTGNRSGKVQTILKENNIESENIGGFMTLKDELPSIKP
jgi:rhodanese-related sulfurtransferase